MPALYNKLNARTEYGNGCVCSRDVTRLDDFCPLKLFCLWTAEMLYV